MIMKGLLLVASGTWHAWVVMPNAPVGILIGVFPYYLLILAWDFLRPALAVPVLLLISWLAISAGLGFRNSISSTGGVALAIQSILASGTVGIAIILRLLVPVKKRKNGVDSR